MATYALALPLARSRSRKASTDTVELTSYDGQIEDLMHQAELTLQNDTTRSRTRMIEDDMEDLISIPVAQALQPRRSHSNTQTYLPSSTSSTSLSSLTVPHATNGPARTTSENGRVGSGAEPQSQSSQPSILSTPSTPAVKRRQSPSPSPSPSKQLVPLPGTSSPAKRRPSNSPGPSLPRAGTARPSNPGKKMAFPSSSVSESTPPSTAAVKARTRAHTRATPSASKKPATPRSRSLSTSNSLDAVAFRSAAADEAQEKVPPWMDQGPAVYRANDGSLRERGEVGEMVLPAVARKLEAERLAKLSEADREHELIHRWDRDGTPLSSREIGSRSPRPSCGGGGRDVAEHSSPEGQPPSDPQTKAPSSPDSLTVTAPLPIAPSCRRPLRSSRSNLQDQIPSLPPPSPEPPNGEKMTERPYGVVEQDGHKGGCCGCVVM